MEKKYTGKEVDEGKEEGGGGGEEMKVQKKWLSIL
jgi:hypothetical protein